MTEETFTQRAYALDEAYAVGVDKLKKEYIEANRKYSVGDILKAGAVFIRVKEAKILFKNSSYKTPEIVYWGPKVHINDLKPCKSGGHYIMPQSAVEKKCN